MAEAASARTRRALELFAPLGPNYERYARVLSLGQDPRWRRFLVSQVEAGPGDRVLDVATGTGAVAQELLRQKGCTVVGVDQSTEMLSVARQHLPAEVELVEASAENLPFEDDSFDGLTVTYLLRYVDDAAATMAELARVVRPGGTVASLEFAVPEAWWAAPPWRGYTRAVMPAVGSIVSPAWAHTGRFLGPSIENYWREHPLDDQLADWDAAGIGGVRWRRMSNGAAIVLWGRIR